MAEYERTKREVERALNQAVNKTLGEVDVNHVFNKTNGNPKVTGIAGDVVEQSLLGYPANSDQSPDLIVDGVETELKTTGIRYSANSLKKKKQKNSDFEAKEPMSITAVSPNKIVHETFKDSNFWHKLEQLLMVYYHYDSPKTVKSWDYKNFYIKGYEWHHFSKDDCERLKSDWLRVQGFIQDAQTRFPDNPEQCYPQLGSALRKDLLLIDTAPKWPHSPRFRLKRATVTAMVQEFFGTKYEQLSQHLTSYADIDNLLREKTRLYKGLSVMQLLEQLKIDYTLNNKGDVSKSIGEQIFLKMIGAKSKHLNDIDLFQKANITLKTLVQTRKGGRTEDTKLFPIDFSDFDKISDFEESEFFNYFDESQFVFILFKETTDNEKRMYNKFIGFKRLSFDEDFIEGSVKKAWQHTRNLYLNHEIKETVCVRKSTGKVIINSNGTVKTKLNFIKSKGNNVFVRGSGFDSKKGKTLVLQGIAMYVQNVWVRGDYLAEKLSKINFLD